MYKMLTRSQTKMNSNMSIMSIMSIKSESIPKNKVKQERVAIQQRMTTRSQARQVEEDEVIVLHVNPSKNRRIIKDDVDDVLPRRSSRINFDEASKAWRSNKRSIGNGQFEYVM